jgi:glycosyltransferase involved in cell wall biosynthesis
LNFLLINQAFVSPSEPGHTRHFELAQYIKDNGHSLTIVASDLNYQTGKRIVERKGIFTEQMVDGVRVLRTYIYPALHKSFFWRIVSFISFMFTSIWAGLSVRNIDLVIGTSPPIFQAVSSWVIAFLRRKPYLLEVRDLWPEFAVDMGVLKNRLLIRLSRWLENFLYQRAKHILVNSPAYRDYLLGKGVPSSKITFIPYGTDISMFSPDVDGSNIRQELGFEDKFIISYTGALGLANDIPTIIRAAKRLEDEPGIQFVLFGDGKERVNLEAQARELGLKNLTFAGSRPKHEMPQVLAASDAGLAILQNIPMFRTTYPNKVFDYMAAGRPTILAIDGVIRDVIETANGGIFVQPGDDQAVADAARRLFADKPASQLMGLSARTYLVENFDRRQKMQATQELLITLAEKEL